MELFHTDAMPGGARLLANLAQARADDLGHATVSAAHVASTVLEMEPVRALLGDAAARAPVEAAVERALMLTLKSHGKRATFDAPIGNAMVAGRVTTTASFLRLAITGKPSLATLDAALSAHAEAIAALLDAPRVFELLSAPTSPATGKLCAHLALGVSDAIKRGHRDATTRHVVLAGLRVYDGVLAKRGLSGLGDACAQIEALLDREPKRTSQTIHHTPRLVGAVAEAIANTEAPLSLAILSAALRGDEPVAFARAAFNDAITRAAAAAKEAGGAGG